MNTTCSIPHTKSKEILLAHGGGGKLTHQLISSVFYPAFDNEILHQEHDGAVIPLADKKLAFTTDSFVVDPIFFPGGDIGDLAVNGTVNDLSCCGATPLYLSAGFIIEEGFPVSDLEKITQSMALAAKKAGVHIVTGDTKVVERGKCDKIFINTSGIGIVPNNIRISPLRATAGDSVIVTGYVGEHGITILSTREHLGFEATIKSDTAPLNKMVLSLLSGVPDVHVLRDPTRGGVSATLNEIAQTAHVCIELDENQIPVSEPVAAACDLLGLDPLSVANEGILLIILPSEYAEQAVRLLKNTEFGKQSAIIGKIKECDIPEVILNTALGGSRVVDMISGEQLPRIC